MSKGDKVQFRARAVNKGGVSEPSDPTPVLTARPRKAPPLINRDQVYANKIWCRTGKQLKLEDIEVNMIFDILNVMTVGT